MAINGTMTLRLVDLQKRHPKGEAVEREVASSYKSLGREQRARFPYKPKAERMEYGSKGKAYPNN